MKSQKIQNVIMCGIDVHDNSLVCRIGLNSEPPKTKITKNTQKQRFALFEYLKKLAEKTEATRIVVAYETSTIGFCIYDDCVEAEIECHILAATKIRKSRDDTKKKNDIRDANLILETLRGHVLAGNELPDIWIPDHHTRDDRELVRSRLDVANKQAAVKTQIRTLLKRQMIKKPSALGDGWTKRFVSWLEKVAIELEASSCKGTGIALSTLIRQLSALEGEIKALDKAIAELSETKRYKKPAETLIETIKGVGLLTAMVFLTEMGDLRRFKNRKKVGSFLGLVPTSNESGEADDRKGHITRTGPSRLRRILNQAAWVRICRDRKEGAYYDKITRKNPKKRKIAVVACMRRLGVLMWHLALEKQQEEKIFTNVA